MGCIYLVTSPSGKQYVGQTVRTFEERWRDHCSAAEAGSNSCRAIANAIRKYGRDSFKTRILHETDNLDELNRLEASEIDARRTLAPDGYNLATGGGNSRHSAEARSLMSEQKKEHCADPEVRRAMSERLKKQWADPELRRAQSERLKEYYSDPEARLAQSKRTRARFPNIFADGLVFESQGQAESVLGLGQCTVSGRIKSTSERFHHWYLVPNHNHPECDAVEECWALMQFAKACPGHENVPDWASPHGKVPAGFWNA